MTLWDPHSVSKLGYKLLGGCNSYKIILEFQRNNKLFLILQMNAQYHLAQDTMYLHIDWLSAIDWAEFQKSKTYSC